VPVVLRATGDAYYQLVGEGLREFVPSNERVVVVRKGVDGSRREHDFHELRLVEEDVLVLV